jgi:thiamine pyrophosphokinase
MYVALFVTRDFRLTGIFNPLPLLSLLISFVQTPCDVVLLGGLSGRLDQTVHTLSFLHKLRKSGRRIFVVTDENVGWVLDEVGLLFFFSFPPRFFHAIFTSLG